MGLETVGLKGEGFHACVKEGDRVKAGELLAEVDLNLLKSKNISAVTPVILCGGEGEILGKEEGKVKAGKTPVFTVGSELPAEEKKTTKLNFDFLQKLGGIRPGTYFNFAPDTVGVHDDSGFKIFFLIHNVLPFRPVARQIIL